MSDVRELIIIGGGPAGYTAALYAARANLQPLVIEGFNWGGQLMITSDVENYPGYPDGVHGAGDDGRVPPPGGALRRRVRHRRRDARRLLRAAVPRLGRERGVPRPTTVIVATGASARWLGLASRAAAPGPRRLRLRHLRRRVLPDKELIVVGGGDTAMEEALFLTRFASKVDASSTAATSSAPRRSWSTAPARTRRSSSSRNAVVEEILGDDDGRAALRAARTRETGETTELRRRRRCSSRSATTRTRRCSSSQLDHDENGYLVTKPGTTETNIPGVFAAGDVQDHVYRQAVTAAGSRLHGGARRRALPRGGGGAQRACSDDAATAV